jgi:hypothetical protein
MSHERRLSDRRQRMQADCFAEYTRCAKANHTSALAADLVCTTALISCVNAHLYASVGEHLVDRPGEADVTGKAFLEAGLVVKTLEGHESSVQAFANRARALNASASMGGQGALRDFERDLDAFVQTVLQDLQKRHHSD